MDQASEWASEFAVHFDNPFTALRIHGLKRNWNQIYCEIIPASRKNDSLTTQRKKNTHKGVSQ